MHVCVYVYICLCVYVHVQMFLLMRCSNKKFWKHFCEQSFHLYSGIFDFYPNKIKRKFPAPSKAKRSHIVFFFGYISPLLKLDF